MGKRRDTGTGSVYWSEERQRWVAEIDAPPKDGKRRKHKRYFKLKKDAQRQVQDWMRMPERQTLTDFLQDWLENTIRRHRAPATYRSYEGIVRLHLVPQLGHIALDKLTAQHIQRLVSQMQDAGKHANRTIEYTIAVLSQALNRAVALGLLARNPAEHVDTPRVVRRQHVILNKEQRAHFLAVLDGHRTGCKRSTSSRSIWACVGANWSRWPGGMWIWTPRHSACVPAKRRPVCAPSRSRRCWCRCCVRTGRRNRKSALRLAWDGRSTGACSRPSGVHRCSRATCTGISSRRWRKPGCHRCPSTTCGTRALACWQRRTCRPLSRCVSWGIARWLSPQRSTATRSLTICVLPWGESVRPCWDRGWNRGYSGKKTAWCRDDIRRCNRGEPGGDRTLDPLIKSQVLYH